MTLSVPLSELVLAQIKKPPSGPGDLRAMAEGVLAHVAIQTFYRLEHPGHFIITERLITIGDARISTISKFDKLVGQGRTLLNRALKAASKNVPTALKRTLEADELYAVLAMMVDVATNLSTAAKLSRKRFDILDFGPLGSSAAWPWGLAQGYEIKPAGGVKDGTAYIRDQTAALNQTFGDVGGTLGKLFNLTGMTSYRAQPGAIWPPVPHVLPIGPNLLYFRAAGPQAPGVIVYEWLSFRRVSLARLWRATREAAQQVRDAYKRQQGVAEDVVVVATAMAAMAAMGAAMAAIELAAALAASAAAAGETATVALSARQALALMVALPAPALADLPKQSRLLDAVAYAADPTAAPPPGLAPGASGLADQPSGGTPSADDEAVGKLADRISREFLNLYAVRIGQGDDILDDGGMAVLTSGVGDWLRRFIAIYGLDAFKALFGVTDLNDEGIFLIAQTIITTGELFVERRSYGDFLGALMTLSTEDILDSLPEQFGDDGEPLGPASPSPQGAGG